MDWLFPLAVTVILSVIKNAIGNEQKKEEIKRALLKVRDAINLIYVTDEIEESSKSEN